MQRLKVEHENEVLKAEIKTINNLYWEIHGNIGPLMALTKTNLTVLANHVNDSQKDEIESIKSLIGEAIDDIRSLTRSVNTEYIKRQTMEELIQFELKNKQRRGGIVCELAIDGEEPPMSEDQKVGVFRIMQEVLNNTIKHAQASKITAHLTNRENGFTLKMTDDGCGFDNETTKSGTGTGLMSIQSRARQIGGDLQIESRPSEGTQISLVVHTSAPNTQ
ncbi:MAG: ATP-binding protein [Bacteroidota bacterium]